MQWRLAEAKNKFTEVVNKALNEGPQWVQRRQDQVVVLSADDYHALLQDKPSFKNYVFAAPVDLSVLDLTRSKTSARTLDL